MCLTVIFSGDKLWWRMEGLCNSCSVRSDDKENIENSTEVGSRKRKREVSSDNRGGDSCSNLQAIKSHKANGSRMLRARLFKFSSSQVEDVTEGHASLRDRTAFVLCLQMSQQAMKDYKCMLVFLLPIIIPLSLFSHIIPSKRGSYAMQILVYYSLLSQRIIPL